MKRLLPLSGALALGALILSGCSTFSRKPAPPRAFALAITVHGSLQPTPTQWAAIQAAAVKELAAAGCVLVSDLALADRIIRIDFTPDPDDPESSGRAVVLGYLPNPYRTLTASGPFGSLSYVSTSTPRAGSSYYDPVRTYSWYSDSWYSDGYTYNAPSGTLVPVTPPVVAPPRRHPPRHHESGAPDGDRPPPSRYAGRTRGDHPRPPRDAPTNPRYERPATDYTRSGSDGGSSYSSSSGSSGSSGSSSHSSYSSTGSSYSPPSVPDQSNSHSPRSDREP